MLVVGGKEHPTVTDAAKQLGVSAKTINSYIKNGIIPPPPQIEQGIRMVNIYPNEYIDKAKRCLTRRRKIKKRRK